MCSIYSMFVTMFEHLIMVFCHPPRKSGFENLDRFLKRIILLFKLHNFWRKSKFFFIYLKEEKFYCIKTISQFYSTFCKISSKGKRGGPAFISAATKLNSNFIALTHSPEYEKLINYIIKH